MDLAVESGRLAGEAVVAAKEKGDFSAETLASYQQALEESFVMPCMNTGESCLALARAGGYEDDPAKAFNDATAALAT